MKKLICLALALILVLTACSKPEADEALSTGSEGEISKPSESVSSAYETAEPSSEEIFAQSAEDSFFSDFQELKNLFSSLGIAAEAEDFRLGDGNNFSFKLTLTKKGASVSATVAGKYVYNPQDFAETGQAEELVIRTFSVSACAVDGRRAAIFGLNYFAVLDTETMELSDFSECLPKTEGLDNWAVSCCAYGGGYALAVQPFPEDLIDLGGEGEKLCLCVTDENGGLLSFKTVPEDPYFGGWYGYQFPYFINDSAVLSFEGEDYLLANKRLYRFSDGEAFVLQGETYPCDNGYALEETKIYKMKDGWNGELIGRYFLLLKGSLPVDFLPLDFDFSFNGHPYEISGLSCSVSPDGKTAEISITQPIGATLHADFKNRTAEMSYSIAESQLKSLIASSPDGKFSLWSSEFFGGGDILQYYLILKNNETKELSFLGSEGGMYGGYGGSGFLRNGDIYRLTLNSLKIYDPAGKKLIFDLSENFPLGLVDPETEYYRHILTFRRNPEDFTFIVVYVEGPDESFDLISNTFDGLTFDGYDANYKIAFLDAEGNLTQSYDTGCPAAGSNFGIQDVSMRYSEEALTLIIGPTKGSDGFTGVFDRSTHEFKIVSGK